MGSSWQEHGRLRTEVKVLRGRLADAEAALAAAREVARDPRSWKALEALRQELDGIQYFDRPRAGDAGE
jgi:hypothetical protein